MERDRNLQFVGERKVAFNKFSSFGVRRVTRLLTANEVESAHNAINSGDPILIDVFCYSIA